MATTNPHEPAAPSFADGRDEMNLADFPISVLSRRPPKDAGGRLVDQVVSEATTYDPVARRRVPQRVTLSTSSRVGLPTPADENVVLALLHAAKRADGFAGPRVHFSPHQLFRVMRWDANGRSYTRLGAVLLRLKSLTLRYENAWWDSSGRRYEEEFATGIVAEYRLVKSRVRRKENVQPPSYVHWAPRFQASLAAGNLKKLDLDRLFALETPTAQRMYRFLDKRFYNSGVVEMDLREFACGHLGVTPSPNVAELKRRVAPAVAELEAAGFVEPEADGGRFLKVKPGVWRIRLRRAAAAAIVTGAGTAQGVFDSVGVDPRVAGAERQRRPGSPDAGDRGVAAAPPPATRARGQTHVNGPIDPARALISAFYEAWDPGGRYSVSEADLAKARELVGLHGEAGAAELVGPVVALLRSKFPAARRFGAALPYFEEADRARRSSSSRKESELRAEAERQAERGRDARRAAEDEAFFNAWSPAWEALPEPDREEIRAAVLRDHPYLGRPLLRRSKMAGRFFLEELARRRGV